MGGVGDAHGAAIGAQQVASAVVARQRHTAAVGDVGAAVATIANAAAHGAAIGAQQVASAVVARQRHTAAVGAAMAAMATIATVATMTNSAACSADASSSSDPAAHHPLLWSARRCAHGRWRMQHFGGAAPPNDTLFGRRRSLALGVDLIGRLALCLDALLHVQPVFLEVRLDVLASGGVLAVQIHDLGDGLRFRLLKPKLGHGGLEAIVEVG